MSKKIYRFQLKPFTGDSVESQMFYVQSTSGLAVNNSYNCNYLSAATLYNINDINIPEGRIDANYETSYLNNKEAILLDAKITIFNIGFIFFKMDINPFSQVNVVQKGFKSTLIWNSPAINNLSPNEFFGKTGFCIIDVVEDDLWYISISIDN